MLSQQTNMLSQQNIRTVSMRSKHVEVGNPLLVKNFSALNQQAQHSTAP
jgi:hypothetical protein